MVLHPRWSQAIIVALFQRFCRSNANAAGLSHASWGVRVCLAPLLLSTSVCTGGTPPPAHPKLVAPLFDVGPKRRSLQNLVFKRNTFRIAFLKPGLCGILGSEDLSLSPTSLLRSKVPGEGIRPVGLIYLILAKHSFMRSSSKRTCASMASCNAAVPLLDNSAEPFCNSASNPGLPV